MQYHRPTTLDAALGILKNPGIQVLAGATDVLPATTRNGVIGPVLDLTGIAGLNGISKADDGWRIGATTSWATVAAAKLPPAFAALQRAAREVGSRQIQNSATVAGNLCNASPAADGVPPLMVLDAVVELASVGGVRHVALGEFIRGVRETDLGVGEIVTGIFVPEAAVRGSSAFEKLGARKYLVISICMVAARVEITGGKISAAAVSIGACSPVARRLPELEMAMVGCVAGDAAKWESEIPGVLGDMLSPIDDIRADGPYRHEAAVELTTRAINRAIQGAA